MSESVRTCVWVSAGAQVIVYLIMSASMCICWSISLILYFLHLYVTVTPFQMLLNGVMSCAEVKVCPLAANCMDGCMWCVHKPRLEHAMDSASIAKIIV